MEGGGGDEINVGNGGGAGGSRWNPTKEQINMLESLYKQGLRTPSAEQIQQITNRLKAFGHIEGKNVFYWFQNHKARQRQKQKQHNFAYFNRFLHPTTTTPTPLFSPYHNVVCRPCYIPQAKNDLGLYHQQYPKVPLPTAGGFKRRQNIENNKHPTSSQMYNKTMHDHPISKNEELQLHSSDHHQETLDLFPIHPTGILQAKNGFHDQNENMMNSTPSSSENECSIFGNYYDDEGAGLNINYGTDEHPFFDFFCGN
ncbi:hypothetical protein BUALT_Bualt06G0024000 [Buddleja alternifolia]|uniref:Homeobox domain-containing protein n=1 Tax=Buddleja alternifolia TaxID=168488 RepID=A0AAV6XDF5_9LAMI|nr:hypothetical protein BUALT_Bualt06G0024000 [Buddleja alternifolia]